ncbi:MAG: hypothetical protein KJP00_08330 [Bacteroidia bacterium]|nr:hypothetical protein [Bacteroidia bacterium]
MKNLVSILVLILTAFLFQYIGPWWIAAIPALIVGYSNNTVSPAQSFALGFVAIFLLWAGQSFFINIQNEGILANKIGEIFNGLNATSIVCITGLIGGILGGLAAMTGRLFKRSFSK